MPGASNFALAVAKIREAFPEAFARVEIVDASHAWVGFAGRAPEAARDIVDTFSSSHSGVSVEVRNDLGFTEVEIERAIEAVHYAVLEAPEVRDASTSFDFATGQIRTIVVLANTVPTPFSKISRPSRPGTSLMRLGRTFSTALRPPWSARIARP